MGASGRCPPYRQPVDQQRRLPDPGGHRLAALAAHTDAFVEREVVADAHHAGQYAGAIADQRCALDRGAQTTVLDLVRFGAGEDEP